MSFLTKCFTCVRSYTPRQWLTFGAIGLIAGGAAATVTSTFPRRSPAPPMTVTKTETGTGAFSNGTPYAVFRSDDFEVKYPDWQDAPQARATTTRMWNVFVTNNKCNVIIRATPLADSDDFRSYNGRLIDGAEAFKPEFLKKEIGDNRSEIDALVAGGLETIRNRSFNFLTSKRVSYGIAFVSLKELFDEGCGPYVDEVIGSAVVR